MSSGVTIWRMTTSMAEDGAKLAELLHRRGVRSSSRASYETTPDANDRLRTHGTETMRRSTTLACTAYTRETARHRRNRRRTPWSLEHDLSADQIRGARRHCRRSHLAGREAEVRQVLAVAARRHRGGARRLHPRRHPLHRRRRAVLRAGRQLAAAEIAHDQARGRGRPGRSGCGSCAKCRASPRAAST